MEKKLLSTLREEKGLTQRELASMLRVSHGAVGLWETGKRTPSLKTAIKIANLFNVQVESILFPSYITQNQDK